MVGRAVYNAAAGLLKRRQLLQSSEGRKVASEQGITVPHVWRARCGPSDLDVNLHMNNASYLYCAELARWELSGQLGLLHAAFRNKWTFMVGSQAMRYRYAISPMHIYEVQTRTVAVDDVWLYMNQSFTTRSDIPVKRPRVYAQATVRAIVMSLKGERIPPRVVFDELQVSKDMHDRLYRKDAKEFIDTEIAGFLEWDSRVAEEMKAKFD